MFERIAGEKKRPTQVVTGEIVLSKVAICQTEILHVVDLVLVIAGGRRPKELRGE